jgi:UDP-glucose/iron transport system permease protein
VTTADITLLQTAAALILVAIAVALSLWQRLGAEREIVVAAVRAALQLTALGLVIDVIFETDSLAWTLALLAAMVVFGAFTARGRAKGVPNALPVLLVALSVSAVATVGITVAIGIVAATPRTLIPLGGMVIGNAMVGAATSLHRLAAEMRSSAAEIEARLSLGATAQEAAAPVVRQSLKTGMIGIVDKTKTAGLVFIPGTMVGMLLAGADPTDAVRLQLVLFYVLLGSVAISAVVATTLASRRFFTPSHQLREPATGLR